MKINDNTQVSLPVRNLIALIFIICSGLYGFFQIQERLNKLETSKELMSADLLKKADQTPKNLEMYMLIEHNAGVLEKHQHQLDENVHTKVLLIEAEKKITKLEKDVEELKNKFRKANGSNH
tara:strand:- start:1183 stop:1548 length:366 start_codon:yes stop_codon:yes gene_type:complete